MTTQPQFPTRLASEDVIINAPMSYAGSAQRIFRLRRRARTQQALVAITTLAVLLMVLVWVLVTVWYLLWGLWLVPYRLLRRGARKRKAEMMRHRELLGVIQGSSAASAAAIVTATTNQLTSAHTAALQSPTERVADADRERAIEELRQHMLVGRLTAADFETRVDAVHNAIVRSDLVSALVDLPRVADAASTPRHGSNA
jgi:uncharacterized protein DUF1707